MDKDKEKWLDEERKIFQGRVDCLLLVCILFKVLLPFHYCTLNMPIHYRVCS
jgi:hypothetical protein